MDNNNLSELSSQKEQQEPSPSTIKREKLSKQNNQVKPYQIKEPNKRTGREKQKCI